MRGSSQKNADLGNMIPFLVHNWEFYTILRSHYRPRSEGDNVLGSVRPSVRLSVSPSVTALTAEPFDLRP